MQLYYTGEFSLLCVGGQLLMQSRLVQGNIVFSKVHNSIAGYDIQYLHFAKEYVSSY